MIQMKVQYLHHHYQLDEDKINHQHLTSRSLSTGYFSNTSKRFGSNEQLTSGASSSSYTGGHPVDDDKRRYQCSTCSKRFKHKHHLKNMKDYILEKNHIHVINVENDLVIQVF